MPQLFCRSILVIVALLLTASVVPSASAAPYHVNPCGGAYDPCTITGSTRAPTPEQLSGLDNNLFLQFYAPLLRGHTGNFSWSIRDSSKDGYIIGSVHGPNQIHTQFIFYDGELLCCFTDEPYWLEDINDSNTIVGRNIYTIGLFVADAANAAGGFLKPEIMPQGYPDGIPVGYIWYPEAIDDDGNILVLCGSPFCRETQYYELRVDEPGTVTLLFGALLSMMVYRVRARLSAA